MLAALGDRFGALSASMRGDAPTANVKDTRGDDSSPERGVEFIRSERSLCSCGVLEPNEGDTGELGMDGRRVLDDGALRGFSPCVLWSPFSGESSASSVSITVTVVDRSLVAVCGGSTAAGELRDALMKDVRLVMASPTALRSRLLLRKLRRGPVSLSELRSNLSLPLWEAPISPVWLKLRDRPRRKCGPFGPPVDSRRWCELELSELLPTFFGLCCAAFSRDFIGLNSDMRALPRMPPLAFLRAFKSSIEKASGCGPGADPRSKSGCLMTKNGF